MKESKTTILAFIEKHCYEDNKRIIIDFNRINNNFAKGLVTKKEKLESEGKKLYVCLKYPYHKVIGTKLTHIQWCKKYNIDFISEQELNEIIKEPEQTLNENKFITKVPENNEAALLLYLGDKKNKNKF